MIFVLTGQIASGKSTISALYKEKGVKIIDADKIAKYVLNSNQNIKFKVIDLLGNDSFTDSCLNSKYVRNIIFSNDELYNKYNDIVKPYIYEEINKEIKNINVDDIACLDIPLFFGTSWELMQFKTIVVYCSKLTQTARMVSRGLDSKIINKIIDSQVPVNEQLAKATFSISSDVPKEEMFENALSILRDIAEK